MRANARSATSHRRRRWLTGRQPLRRARGDRRASPESCRRSAGRRHPCHIEVLVGCAEAYELAASPSCLPGPAVLRLFDPTAPPYARSRSYRVLYRTPTPPMTLLPPMMRFDVDRRPADARVVYTDRRIARAAYHDCRRTRCGPNVRSERASCRAAAPVHSRGAPTCGRVIWSRSDPSVPSARRDARHSPRLTLDGTHLQQRLRSARRVTRLMASRRRLCTTSTYSHRYATSRGAVAVDHSLTASDRNSSKPNPTPSMASRTPTRRASLHRL